MTNNKQMVSVPRELLERLDFGRNTALALNALKELGALLAAPAEHVEPIAYMRQDDSPYNNLVKCTFTCPGAFGVFGSPEDVRAVVDEPVAWLCEANANSGRRGKWLQYSKEIHDPWQKGEVDTTPLYRHPQRPVVMPERKDESQYRGTSLLTVRRWNACLDEFERLNK